VEEALNLRLLFRAHEQRSAVLARGLQLAETLLRLIELGLQALFGRAQLQVGLALQRLDGRERARVARAAAQADELGTAGKIVERVDDEIAVVRERREQALAEEVLRRNPEPVAQDVDVGH